MPKWVLRHLELWVDWPKVRYLALRAGVKIYGDILLRGVEKYDIMG